MPENSTPPGLFQEFVLWIIAGVSAIGAGILRLINVKVDRKVSKEVFNEYKTANDTAHGVTHSALKEIKDGQVEERKVFRDTTEKLFDKLDGKKDKD